jgi:hypothetical protein
VDVAWVSRIWLRTHEVDDDFRLIAAPGDGHVAADSRIFDWLKRRGHWHLGGSGRCHLRSGRGGFVFRHVSLGRVIATSGEQKYERHNDPWRRSFHNLPPRWMS